MHLYYNKLGGSIEFEGQENLGLIVGQVFFILNFAEKKEILSTCLKVI